MTTSNKLPTVVTLSLDAQEVEIVSLSLSVRRNYIETGNIVLSAHDAAERGEPVNALTSDQMRLILAIESIQKRLCQ